MSTNTVRLTELIARVTKATGPDRELDSAIHRHFWPIPADRISNVVLPPGFGKGPLNDAMDPTPTYTSSSDAALALMERKVPGALWEKYPDGGVQLYRRGRGVYDEIPGTYASPRPLPLAIILATLRTLQSQEGGAT